MCESGKSISIRDLNFNFLGCADPDCPNINPDDMKIMWDAAKPKLGKEHVGKIIITSTPRGNIYYKELYQNYKDMAETKLIGSIHVVTDTETGQEKIGDVEGGLNDMMLEDHIRKHGHMGLLETLGNMIAKVLDVHHGIERKLNEHADSINENDVKEQ